MKSFATNSGLPARRASLAGFAGVASVAVPWLGHAEDSLIVSAFAAMAVLPVLELILRTFLDTGLPGTSGYVQNLTLWVGFLGAMIASRERRHLNFSTGAVSLPPPLKRTVDALAGAISTAVAAGLFWASLQFVRAEMDSLARIGGWLPVWAVVAVLPAAFAVITFRFVAQAGGARQRALALLGFPAAAAIGLFLGPYAAQLVIPALVAVVAAALLGAPIFVVLGGAALVLFFAEGVPVAAIPVEAYRIVVSIDACRTRGQVGRGAIGLALRSVAAAR